LNHKINISSNYKLQEKIRKLIPLDKESQLKLIYEWTKINIINLKEFSYIMDCVLINKNLDLLTFIYKNIPFIEVVD
jgi:hypothetical protein